MYLTNNECQQLSHIKCRLNSLLTMGSVYLPHLNHSQVPYQGMWLFYCASAPWLFLSPRH